MIEKTIAIYARYSSDLQNPLSCEDQITLCKQYIARNQDVSDLQIKTYSDTAVSGTLMKSRPFVLKLVDAIEQGRVAYIVAEGLDRISRNTGETANFYELCNYHGVFIFTVLEGKITKMNVGLTSIMSDLQVKQISERTRRGQMGSISRGKAAGGLAYGYKKRLLKGKKELEAGLRDIVPAQAKVIQRIYDETCKGLSPAKIAFGLNEDKIPSPRGGRWTAVTISGHYGRGDGILQNPIYKGLMVWNRNNFKPHPITGVRRVRKNDEKDWETFYNPALRIISDKQWAQVQKIREKRHAKNQQSIKAKNRIEIGFQIKCVRCGGNMNRHSGAYVICGQYKRSRGCSQGKKVNVDHLFLSIYDHLMQNFDELWEDWKKALVEENARQKSIREGNGGKENEEKRSLYKTVLNFDNFSKSIFFEAIKAASDNPVDFVQRIIAEVSVDKMGEGIIASRPMPEWKALEGL